MVDFTPSRSSAYTGNLDVVNEVDAITKILLALSNEAKMLIRDPCEVWRKVDLYYQVNSNDLHSNLVMPQQQHTQMQLQYMHI